MAPPCVPSFSRQEGFLNMGLSKDWLFLVVITADRVFKIIVFLCLPLLFSGWLGVLTYIVTFTSRIMWSNW